ncbi:MAG: dienelactone hydrolase family protein [Euryarchaeota archaeon]|nr:dienelactone hydrolase family protein [Euryarchaeota archaeon]
MKRKMLCIGSVVVMILAGAMFSGCVQEQKPAGKTSEELAVDIVSLLKDKNYTGVYSYFNSSITTKITVEQFQNIWEQQIIIPNGNLTKIVKTRLTIESGYSIVYVTSNFTKQNVLDVKIIFNAQNKVISLTVNPPQTEYQYAPPSYVNLSAFTEMNISVGSGQWKLPGTLSIPKGAGPFPAVVLVHGSGPNDRDESVGPNKPFKDIAGGLASKGIVVLRYEKRTKQYPQESAAIQNFTVQDETIADALAAVNVLDASSAVNHSKIFVLGHSLGGMLAPRIGVQDHRIAGVIILAGPTRHLEDLILEQSRYLANISGINQSEQIASLEKLVMKVKMLNISLGEDVLGAPKAYWADLATYDPVVTAQSLHIPLLILQGIRDYQVTMTDFARWNETFFGNVSVTLKTYPTLNHLFITGTGVPTNAEYLVEGHVAEEVVADIAAWIKNR